EAKKFPYAEFRALFTTLEQELQTEDGLWTLRGFVDTAQRVYSLTTDTKVISKALELMLLPRISGFWEQRGYEVVPAKYQNFYPDLSLVRAEERYALDLKTTYRLLRRGGGVPSRVSGFTLGAFTGYFRHRDSTKNVTFPYGSYRQHYVVLIVYTQLRGQTPGIYPLERLSDIMPPIRDIEIFIHEKWRVANDRPGSGNTRNIGSITDLAALREGIGPFVRLGEEGEVIFNEYWQQYMNRDMARAAELSAPPFRNLREYLRYRNRLDLIARLEETDETADT
ncbi:MAG: hypothetical protein DRI48_03620, partial [Chloroflexi bacterium]